MSIILVKIHDDGEHWDKKIYLFGLLIYHRHDYTKESDNHKTVGFNSGQYCPGEIYDE